MRHIFIINPVAGKVNRAEELKAKIESLRLPENECKIYITRAPYDAREIARKEAESGEETRIYASGGDGTANEVLSGIVGYKNCALGIIPIGSGNDFVRAFSDYTRDDFLDIERMVKGKESLIDLVECGGRYSMNIVTVGFDCAVACNVERFKRIPLVSGSLAYKMSILYCLFTKRKHNVHIWVDDKPFEASFEKTTLLSLGANGNYYGGGIKAAPLAVFDDGYMDFVHAETISVPKFISLLGKYIKGEHVNNPKLPFVRFMRCKKLRYESEDLLDVNLDGEIISMKNPEMKLIEKAVRVILPAKNKEAAL